MKRINFKEETTMKIYVVNYRVGSRSSIEMATTRLGKAVEYINRKCGWFHHPIWVLESIRDWGIFNSISVEDDPESEWYSIERIEVAD
jgi:hypothetical protein